MAKHKNILKTWSLLLLAIICFCPLLKGEPLFQVYLDSLKASYYAQDYEKGLHYSDRLFPLPQNLKSQQYIEANMYTGLCQANQWKNQEAVSYFEVLFDFYQRQQLAIDTFYLKAKVSTCNCMDRLGEAENAIANCNEVIQKAKALFPTHEVLPLAYNGLGNAYLSHEEYDMAIEAYKQAIEHFEVLYNCEPHLNIGKVYNNISLAYKEIYDFKASEQAINDALYIYLNEVGPYDKRTLFIYVNLSHLFVHHIGDYKRGVDIAEDALHIADSIFADGHILLGNVYNTLVYSYAISGQYEQAKAYFPRLEQIYLRHAKNDPYGFFTCLQNIANVYINTKEYKLATRYLDKALKHSRSLEPISKLYTSSILSIYGDYEWKQKNYTKAVSYFEQTYQCNRDEIGLLHPNTLASYADIAFVLYDQANFLKAKAILTHVLDKLHHPDTPLSNLSNRKLEIVSMCYSLLGATLEQLFLQNGSYELLESAIQHHQQALYAIGLFRSRMIQSGAKIHLQQANYVIFDRALKTYYTAYRLEPSCINPQLILDVMELSKAYVLLDANSWQNSITYPDIPDSLIQKEQKLKAEIASLEYRILDTDINKETQKVEWNNTLYQKEQEFSSLINIFNTQYPNYYQLKYLDQTKYSIQQIQKILQPQQAILEYTITDSFIFVLQIQKDRIDLHQIRNDFALKAKTEALYQTIINHPMAIDSSYQYYSQQKSTFKTLSYSLYQKLFLPLCGSPLPEELIIIPDQTLWQIPFECFLKDTLQSQFTQMNYLAHDYAISYNYSSTLWAMMQNQQSVSGKMLIVAPTFLGQTAELKYHLEEANSIKKTFPSTVLSGQDATKTNLFQNAPHYSVLHFATHADVPINSKKLCLWLSGKDESSSKMYLHELYNLKIRANMVVLNACNSGQGLFLEGEGLMSLSRSFVYAGAQSVITTLWEVNDKTSAGIMKQFYKALAEASPKNISLQKVKSLYIKDQKTDYMAHPFFWSAHVAFGNMDTIHIQKRTPLSWVYIGILAGILVLILIILFKNKKPNSTFDLPF